MSYVEFEHRERSARIRGSERFNWGGLAHEVTVNVLRAAGVLSIDHLVPLLRNTPDYLDGRAGPGQMKWEATFDTWLRVGFRQGHFVVDGVEGTCGPIELCLNTLIETGDEVLALVAHLDGWCEVFAMVEAEDAAWLARVIRAGRERDVFRDEMGWEGLLELLAEVEARPELGPVLTSYSSEGTSPVSWYQLDDWYPDASDDAREDMWEALPRERQWDLCVAALRARKPEWNARRIGEHNQNQGYASGLSAQDLVEHLTRTRR